MEITDYLAELPEDERAALLGAVLRELGKYPECRAVAAVRWLGIDRGLILQGKGLPACAESRLPEVVREIVGRHHRGI